jgi:hypothetical protein
MVQITASAGAQVFGMVATDGKRRIRGGYGYGYGYGAGYGERPKKTPVSNTMPPPIVAGADNGGAPESENAEQGWPQTQA